MENSFHHQIIASEVVYDDNSKCGLFYDILIASSALKGVSRLLLL